MGEITQKSAKNCDGFVREHDSFVKIAKKGIEIERSFVYNGYRCGAYTARSYWACPMEGEIYMYTAKNIRNIALLGHGGDGKTALAESMLYLTKGTDRLGRSADGNTVSDFDPEEIKRGYSVSTAVLPVEYNDTKINVLDTPGYFAFAGEVVQALRVADTGIICVSGKNGIAVGTEKAWEALENANLPTMFYVSKMDEDHAHYFRVYESLRATFGPSVVAMTFPVLQGEKVLGVVDLVTRKAWDLNGKAMTLNAEASGRIEALRSELDEAVAETDEALMEKYFEGEPFTDEELLNGIKEAVKTRSLCPVFCGCAMNGLGTLPLLEDIVKYAPNPLDGTPLDMADGGSVSLDENGAPQLFVFKTLSDKYGKNSFFKVISGTVTSDLTLMNARTGDNEKLGRLFFPKGKKYNDTTAVACGDIGVVSKLSSVRTSDTLGVAGKTSLVKSMVFAEPCYTMAIYAKNKGQEDKVANGLVRLNEEDGSFTFGNNPETKEMVISGVGDIHLDVLLSKLKNLYNVEAELRPAKIAYRETIKKRVEIHGRHKKQSGGHGQFGDVYIRFEPQSETEDMIFADETVGGCVPKNFIPSVEKGLRNCIGKGVLAGYPVVFLKATLYFGSYHPVDSSDMAFQTAAGIAFKDGLPTAGPTILEPIGELKVTVPDANMGDIIGDLNKRRGRVMGMNPAPRKGYQIVEAEVPVGEMTTYVIDLRAMTQGRGSYSLKFVRYEEVPQANQAKIIAEAKANEG